MSNVFYAPRLIKPLRIAQLFYFIFIIWEALYVSYVYLKMVIIVPRVELVIELDWISMQIVSEIFNNVDISKCCLVCEGVERVHFRSVLIA